MLQELSESRPDYGSLLDLSGRVALVTGARAGIGAAIAERLAEAGAAVVVHHRGGREEAEQLAERIREDGGRAAALAADVSRRDEVEGLVAAGAELFGTIDVAIGNAALQTYTPLTEMSDEVWDETMATNLRGAMLLTQAVAAGLIEANREGAIVHLSSIVGHDARPATAEYAVSKAGLVKLTEAAAIDYGQHGIRVNALLPGLIAKPGLDEVWPAGVEMWRETAPLGRLGTPDDVADACLFLASHAARWISGASLLIDGGMSSRAPW